MKHSGPFAASAAPSSELLWLGIFSIVFHAGVAVAAIVCNSTSTCEALARPGSLCVEGLCTNPFAGGCLRRLRGEELHPQPRTCNSEDDPSAEADGTCSKSPFDYPEVRVSPGNWESAMFYAWIIQIFLSEVAGVPVSIETSGGGPLSFYDRDNAFSYPTVAGNNFDAIREGNRVGDCAKTEKPCCHVLPEVWEEHRPVWDKAAEEGHIEYPSGNGMLSGSGWFIPDYVARDHPTFKSHFGLKDKRHTLAEIFKRPTTWGDYCSLVSTSECTDDDGVAASKPSSQEEAESYFWDGQYTGHFRATEKNNCTLSPDTCTGAIIDYPCGWSTPTKSQLHWNQIALESDGPEVGGGYPYNAGTQIFLAANATQSPVIIVWWEPEARIDALGYTRISLPKPTQECFENRPSSDHCNMTDDELIGNVKGSCDSAVTMMQRIVSSNLLADSLRTPEATRSPAHEILRKLYIKEVHFSTMLQQWWTRGVDTYNYDPREVVCSWVDKHIAELDTLMPRGYPRQSEDRGPYAAPFLFAAMGLGSAVFLVVVFTLGATYNFRGAKPIKCAQAQFLYLFILGFLIVSISAIVTATVPSLASCIVRQWLETIGYTLGLVPLLVKVAAINKLMQGAARCKRVRISKRKLFGVVAMSLLFVSVFLAIWTAVDPPMRVEEQYLASEGSHIVRTRIGCSSSSDVWAILAVGWELVLVLCASVLAFQSRKIQQEFNESQTLGNMAYLHFLFLAARITVYFMPVEVIEPNVQEGTISYLLSIDTLVSLLIYFGPKFYAIKKYGPEGERGTQNAAFSRMASAVSGATADICPLCNNPRSVNNSV